MFVCDSNILIYAYDSKSPFHKKAKNFLEEKTRVRGEVCLTPQIVLEFFAVITQKARKPLNVRAALEIIGEIQKNKNILFIFPLETTHSKTLELAGKYQIRGRDIFDLYLVATMLDNRITTLCTCNTSDFEKFSEITVSNPLVE